MDKCQKKKPRIRQDRQIVTLHGSSYPKEISQQCTPAIHTEAVQRQGGLPSLSLVITGSWMHLGGGSPSLSSALSTPVSQVIRRNISSSAGTSL